MDDRGTDEAEARVKGFVQSYNRDKGYGFLVPYGAHDTVYVERADIEADPRVLSEEQQVTFTIEFADGHFVARHVQP
ncbi:cold shock domain-containing protein [Streptomyces sp. NBC_00536]|uniref:cold shock domain-containing protein n=1 Tax=Streptomyces sp. NBC_00536 TaxID=2975769 RepID=UPI002E8036DB|nr:cold shock domain-containing protein [Streptomyces sp. NBC_00536]WUC77176.1 cold shock domain-containing protein [Streptomyces sp. NBC_00536]